MTTTDLAPIEKAKRHRRTLAELKAAQAPLTLEMLTAKVVELIRRVEAKDQRKVIEAAQVLLGHHDE